MRTYVLLAVAAALCAAGSVRAADDSVRFSGPLNSRSVRQIEAAINAGARRLVITSEGGDSAASIELGEQIQKHHVEVFAQGYCLSACASHVWLASPSPRVAPNTILGFHDTMTSMLVIADARDSGFAKQTYRSMADREAALYRAAGVNPFLLIRPAYAMEPVCAFIDRSGATPVALVASKYMLYVPSEAALKGAGVKLQDPILDTPGEALPVLIKQLPSRARINVRFDTAQLGASEDAMRTRLSAVPVCPEAVQREARLRFRPPPR